MFSVKHNECVGFESRWKVKKVSSESSSQTTEFKTSEAGCNASEKATVQVQTEATESSKVSTDLDRLAEWLSRIYPKVKRELDLARNSKVFGNYRLLADSVDTTSKLVQEIDVGIKANDVDKATPRISCLSWNKTGNCVALARNFKHRNWCYHNGLVLVYELNREDRFNETPKRKLTTENCVTSLSFHSANAGVLAAGTFTGQIYVWNVLNDFDPLIATFNGHLEYVTQLSWTNDADSTKQLLLASSGTDGLLNLWNADLAESTFNIKAGYKIKSPVFGKVPNSDIEMPRKLFEQTDLGITCFSFSKYIPDLFIVGVEGGLVVKCSSFGASPLKGSTNSTPLFDPVQKYYDYHEGEVTAIQFCPDNKDLFLTSGTDNQVRIYLLSQDDPAQVIFLKSNLNGLSWIPFEDKFIIGCGPKGTLGIYDLISGKPVEHGDTKTNRKSLISLAVNGRRTSHVAVGSDNGYLRLWNIPWHNIQQNIKG